MSPLASGLGMYFAGMVATFLAGLPLTPATWLAVKVAPPWAVALTAMGAAALTATLDHYVVRRLYGTRVLLSVRKYPRRRFRTRVLVIVRRQRRTRQASRVVLERAERYAKVAPFLTTMLFAGFPLPFFIVRVMMPVTGYPLLRYVTAVALGRFGRVYVIAAFGQFFAVPTPILIALLVGGVAVAAGTGLFRVLRNPRKPEPKKAAPS